MKNNEKKYTGYGYHGGGRPCKGENAKRKTVSISGTEEELKKIKELAAKENKTLSRFILDKLL